MLYYLLIMPKIPHIYFLKIAQHLNSTTKAYEWFDTSNPRLSGLTPMDMIKRGRQNALMKVIDNIVEDIWP